MLKRRSEIKGFQDGGMNVDPVSGNEVPTGSLPEEVRDDVDAKLSPGEFVIPADVVRFIGLERLMKMRDEAKKGIQRMAEIGQMGNADEVGEASNGTYEDDEFESEIDDILGEVETEQQMAEGGLVGEKTGQVTRAGRPVYKTKEGANVSELSITVPYKGVWANVPSIHNGKQYSEDEIQDMLNKGKIKPTSVHKSVKEAVDAAKKRSDSLLSEQTKMAFGGYVGSGTDLTKAPKNPSFDVRYYKNKEGATMFITHINGKPMTPVPEGFTQVSAEEAQKVGQAAEEEEKKKKATGSTTDQGSYDASQLDPAVAKFLENETPAERDARMGRVSKNIERITGNLPFVGVAKKATEFIFGKPRTDLAPVETRTPTPVGSIGAAPLTATADVSMAQAAANDARQRALDSDFSSDAAARAAASAAEAVNRGVDPAVAVQAAIEAEQDVIDRESVSITGPGPSTGATASPVTSTGGGITSRDLNEPEPGIDRSGSYDYGGSSYSGNSGFGTGSDYGNQDYGSFFASGGLVSKRQYPAKKKKGKGIAASK